MLSEWLDNQGRRLRPWPHNPRYAVRDDGVILDYKIRKPLSIHLDSKGYPMSSMVRLSPAGNPLRAKSIAVSIVVCETYHGSKPAPGMHAAHENGNKLDNRPENVTWKTPRENIADKKRHGTQPMGSQIVWSKLTEEDVREIRGKKIEGRSLASLGREYGVAYQTIQSALSGRSWGHLA